MTTTSIIPAIVTRSARRATRDVTCGPSTLRVLKSKAHRSARRLDRERIARGEYDWEPRHRVTSWDIS